MVTEIWEELSASIFKVVSSLQGVLHHKTALKMEAASSSETSVTIYQSKQRHITEDLSLLSYEAIYNSFHQQIGLKFKAETSKVLHLEHCFVWC